jgi:peptide/nickel transport system substrate-binding protein
MEMEKKNLAIIILAVILAASGVGNVILAITGGVVQVTPPTENTLIIGFATNPPALDPVDTWDVPAFQVQQQVVQGLVQYNVSDHPNYPIIPVLAESWTWTGADHVEFQLRPGIKFHDGADWDADAALWNLNRLMWFCNYTGTLPDNVTAAFPNSLYWAPDGVTPYIASVSKVNDLRIAIDLSFDFAPFLDLLCFAASFMCSPQSTPKYSYLNVADDVIVGTGPYIMDFDGDGEKDDGEGVYVDVEVRFEKNEDFWGGKEGAPYGFRKPFEKAADILVFDINQDDVSRNMDMLALKIDYLQGSLADMMDTFNSSPQYYTVNQLGKGLCYYYFSMYSAQNPVDPLHPRLNVTWRKALQHAINYTYVTDEIYQGLVVRATPVVPEGMPGYNSSVEIIDMDIPTARALMQSMGYGVGWDTAYPGTDEASWTGANFRTIEVNEFQDHTSNQKMNALLAQNYALIGVTISITVRSWGDYLDESESAPWNIEQGYIGWCPDYLDAFNMIEPLFSNVSHANFCGLNDPNVMDILGQAVITTDPIARQALYGWLTSYLFDVNRKDHEWKYPHAPLFTSLTTYVHSADLTYTAYNVLADMWCWEMTLGEWEA